MIQSLHLVYLFKKKKQGSVLIYHFYRELELGLFSIKYILI